MISSVSGIALKGRYRGQRQRWFAMRFTGEDAEIDIAPRRHKPEFDAWRWAKPAELPELAVPFKRQVYRDVLHAFRAFVG
jgi:putative (di)nucleoside polyphosphate hydrolase